jgi:hypothetical protein
MQELIRIETSEWELTISCPNLQARRKTYEDMLERRNDIASISKLSFKPGVNLQSVSPDAVLNMQTAGNSNLCISELALSKPLFFENTQYQFEWYFHNDDVKSANITHSLRNVAQSFRFASKRKYSAASLIGTLNTGNDIGQLCLPLTYEIGTSSHTVQFTLEVLPTKMQLNTDLPAMYQRIDNEFPLWRFSLAEKTEQNAARSQHRGNFPLLWLAQFKILRQQLETALKVIANSPHSRLQSKTSYIKADRLKGRLSHTLAERVKEDVANKRLDKHYQQAKQYLSVDTPENRFIKMVVLKCKSQLERLTQKIEDKSKGSDDTSDRLSAHFLEELKSWQKPLSKIQKHSFLWEVGEYKGTQRESLVLQQRTGYSTVYRVWQELKYYLDIFARHSTVSMKSVAEVYEVWCFLTMRQLLVNSLGFEEVNSDKARLRLNDYFELQLHDGLKGAGSFTFKRSDGLTARLAHEPVFRRNGQDIRSFWVTQKPDILLEVTFPDGKRCVWLFDAKYRIKTKNDRYELDDVDIKDFVPDDAINQMHRYRDALIHINRENSKQNKSRPVFGAFALYPGFYKQELDENPYAEAIHEVGIGAFALLPSSTTGNNKWLEDFLISQLGSLKSSYSTNRVSDDLYVKESARIPYHGMKQVYHPDLVLAAKLGKHRNPDYIKRFTDGKAQWYHMPEDFFNHQFGHHIANEICYIAIAQEDSGSLLTDKAYRVQSVALKNREEISEYQSGVRSTKGKKVKYWLFQLGEVLVLTNSLINPDASGFRKSLKLTTLSKLQKTCDFENLETVYT